MKEKMNKIKDIIKEELTGKLFECVMEILNDYNDDMLVCVGSDRPEDHHGYEGGWITHTLGVLENAIMIANKYDFLNRDIMVFGAVLHDLGKLNDYVKVGDEFEKTDNRFLLGHCAEGVYMLKGYLDKYDIDEKIKISLLHVVGCHMGDEPSMSVTQPMMPEAIFLNFADHMDALSEPISRAKQITKKGEWTDYIVGTADRKLFMI